MNEHIYKMAVANYKKRIGHLETAVKEPFGQLVDLGYMSCTDIKQVDEADRTIIADGFHKVIYERLEKVRKELEDFENNYPEFEN